MLFIKILKYIIVYTICKYHQCYSHCSRPLQEEKKKKLVTWGAIASMAVVPPTPFFLLPFFSFFYLFKGFSSPLSMLPFR